MKSARSNRNARRFAFTLLAGVVGACFALAGTRWLRSAQAAEREQQARSLVQTGMELAKRGEVEGAMKHWGEAAALAPHFLEPHALQARVYWSRRQFRQAAESFEAAHRAQPEEVELLLELITTLKAAGNQSRIESLCRKAVQLAPKHPKAHAYLGIHLAHQGPQAWAEAARELEIAHKATPRMPIPVIELGGLRQREQRTKDAEFLLQRAWRLLHQGPQTVAFLESGAEVELRRAEVAYNLTSVYRQLGREVERDQWLQKFRRCEAITDRRRKLNHELQQNRKAVDKLLDLSELEIETENPQEAERLIRQANQLAPHHPRVAELLKRFPQWD